MLLLASKSSEFASFRGRIGRIGRDGCCHGCCHGKRHNRHNPDVRIERSRENVFTVTATSQELSALVAGARMALEAMRSAPEPPPAEAVEILERVLRDFDLARERLAGGPTGGG
jgi:hypothetical protein